MTFREVLLWSSILLAAGALTPERLPPAMNGREFDLSPQSIGNANSLIQNGEGSAQSHGLRKRDKIDGPVQILTGIVEWEYKPLAWDCDVPNCDHFALYDDATHNNYELDDARAALPFEGKRARVTGVVDDKRSSIYVISIKGWK